MSDSGTVIAIRLDEAAAYGYQAAAVLQQTRWVIKYELQRGAGDGWFEGSAADLAALTALSVDQVRRAMAQLIEAGAVERERQVGPHGETKPKYRPTGNPANQAGRDSATPRARDSATPGGRDSATPTSSREKRVEKPPPTPSKEGETDGRLFEPGTKAAGSSLRATKVRRHTAETAAMSASFAPFWSDYPGSAKSGKGSRIKGEEAWVRVLARGQDRNGEPVTTATYARRLGNYNDARRLFHEHWAALGVPDAWPKIINASTFINSKSKLFAEPWTIEDVADYWPAPDGREWTETKPRAPKLTRAEFQARVAASKETANNG